MKANVFSMRTFLLMAVTDARAAPMLTKVNNWPKKALNMTQREHYLVSNKNFIYKLKKLEQYAS